MKPTTHIIVSAAVGVGLFGVKFLVSTPPRNEYLPVSAAVARSVPPDSDVAAAEPGFLGVLVAGEGSTVAAATSGLVKEVRVRLGDQVAQGAVLAVIDDAALRGELSVAQASLVALGSDRDKSKIELGEARERLARWTEFSTNRTGMAVVSGEEMSGLRFGEQYARQKLNMLNARVVEQRARVKAVRRRIDQAVVRAPFDGVVASRYVNPGVTVQPGQPVVHLVFNQALWVRFAVPEQESQALRRGATVAVYVEKSAAVLQGVIETVAPEVDTGARMIIAEARIVGPEPVADAVVAGRIARVHIDLPHH